MNDFQQFFRRLAHDERHISPHQWQMELAGQADCSNRLIRIPTGFGKTLGILSSWLWNRVEKSDDRWPRRLVWCLPMRVLVEQTYHEACASLSRLGILWDNHSDHSGKIGVHLLMGGIDAGNWHLYPEHCSVLIGTQDMLLSRALNRGYASPRARWPMEFGLLNQDCLWVMDEVQLMDIGLATSAQLQAFRDDDSREGKCPRPCVTWWMSATLQKGWLTKSPDTGQMAAGLNSTSIPASDRNGHLWEDVRKPFRLENGTYEAKGLAALIEKEHTNSSNDTPGLTLVILNTVDFAVNVYDALSRSSLLKDSGTDIRLIHSRFRPAERRFWREAFLSREHCKPGINRIIVSTQVVEAGVDISANLLITKLAPWASLIQRFGRCARWGGSARVIIVDTLAAKARAAVSEAQDKYEKAVKRGQTPKSPVDQASLIEATETKASLPYKLEELRAARGALAHLTDIAPISLEAFEESHPELLSGLYPFDPLHLLLRHELNELFDTAPDLSGSDIDISRFIRSGEEKDLHVFWLPVPEKTDPPPDTRPLRDALCAVPVYKAREWLFPKAKDNRKGSVLNHGMRAWVWDWLDGGWRKAEIRDLYPGQTVLVASDCGGYRKDKGWDPGSSGIEVEPIAAAESPPEELADARQEDEALSASEWQTIAVHGRETARIAREIARVLNKKYEGLYGLIGRWHDVGKGHPAFNGSIGGEDRPDRSDLAKAPKEAWLPLTRLYPMEGERRRAGFRHEIVSVMALISVLKFRNPDHAALLGPWRELLSAAGFALEPSLPNNSATDKLEQEILNLNVEEFNLAAYLICAHHGKARLAWHAGPADQSANDAQLRIMGVKDGDEVPGIVLVDSEGIFLELPGFRADLSIAAAGLNPKTGMGWTDRVLRLLDAHGPFTLAWMEAIIRAADQRASRLTIIDDLLNREVNA
jgi:CRISPR-associated endonuclease/helicase Cas3